MNINELLISTKGKLVNNINLEEKYNKIKINSKEVQKEDIFIAIIGKNHDGHIFINEAIKNGAKLIITQKEIKTNIPYIIVKDTTKTLGDIAHYMIKKYSPKVIAITGSIGKTTTKSILYNLLKTKYKTLTNEKNYNNDIGVPLTVFNLKKENEILLLELGMNHPKEISYLSNMVNPNISGITNIGSSHIGFLKTKENILKAKLEVLDGMKEKILFVNGDDELLKDLKNKKKSGFNKTNELIGYEINSNLYSSSFKINYNNEEYLINTNLPRHLLNNVLLALHIALYLKIDIKDIQKVLKNYKSENMRMDIIKDINNNTIINDCYNSSFESLTGVLNLLENENQNKILILGDIKELGNLSKEIHQSLTPYIEKIKNKEVYLVGKEMKNIKTNANYFENYKDLLEYLKTKRINNKLILIKGSRGMKLENITNYFTNKKL
ncbi:MAG: UDP-N-acetylmuramoyl-tripeptide--D-alanyl-D-alanine ligase [Bacilli bacterium]|nr:UDP-N-acetylmuramoyl-tripeptide--D-alanyl-D-alanine ligase [Bacilli bacterium]